MTSGGDFHDFHGVEGVSATGWWSPLERAEEYADFADRN